MGRWYRKVGSQLDVTLDVLCVNWMCSRKGWMEYSKVWLAEGNNGLKMMMMMKVKYYEYYSYSHRIFFINICLLLLNYENIEFLAGVKNWPILFIQFSKTYLYKHFIIFRIYWIYFIYLFIYYSESLQTNITNLC